MQKELLTLAKVRKVIRVRTYEDENGEITIWPEGGYQLFPKAGRVLNAKIIYVNDAGLNPAGLCGHLTIEWVEEEKLNESACAHCHYTPKPAQEAMQTFMKGNEPDIYEFKAVVPEFKDPTPSNKDHDPYKNEDGTSSCPCPECTIPLSEIKDEDLVQLPLFTNEDFSCGCNEADHTLCDTHYEDMLW